MSAGSYVVFVAFTGEDGGYYRLLVDERLVFDNWTATKAEANWTTLSLEPIPHKVVLEHRGRSWWLGTRLRLGSFPHGGVVARAPLKLAPESHAVVAAVWSDTATVSAGAHRTSG